MASIGGTCDEFGFSVDEELVDAYRQHQLRMADKRVEMREQWRVLISEIKEKNQVIEQATSQQERIRLAGEKTREVRRILKGPVVNGIPTEFRPYAWPLLCGVEKARAARGEHVFPTLLQRCEGADRNQELELDLDRTFPGHPLLDKESAYGVEGVASLHRVLNSYALYNPAVGYCQSMNFIVGILLIMDVEEEDAFWMISHISDSVLPNHFAPPMLGAQVDNKLFAILMRRHLPELAGHLESIGLDAGMVCGQWFLCIFCNRMPCETVCRIWDVVFCKGPTVIFQVALGIFKLCQDSLLACDDMGQAIHLLRAFETSLFDSDALLECAMLQFSAIGDVSKLREDLLPQVRKEYQEHRKRMEAYRMQENIKKGKDLLKSVGGRLSEMGHGLGAALSQEVKERRDGGKGQGELLNAAKAKGAGWFTSASSLFSSLTAPGPQVPLAEGTAEGKELGAREGGREGEGEGGEGGTASASFWKKGEGLVKEGGEGLLKGVSSAISMPSKILEGADAEKKEGEGERGRGGGGEEGGMGSGAVFSVDEEEEDGGGAGERRGEEEEKKRGEEEQKREEERKAKEKEEREAAVKAKAEEEGKRAEEEKRRKEEEAKKAEEEKRRAEEEKRKAQTEEEERRKKEEEEKRKAAEEESKRKEEESEKKEEEERKRKEEEESKKKEEEERKQKEAEKQKEEAEKQKKKEEEAEQKQKEEEEAEQKKKEEEKRKKEEEEEKRRKAAEEEKENQKVGAEDSAKPAEKEGGGANSSVNFSLGDDLDLDVSSPSPVKAKGAGESGSGGAGKKGGGGLKDDLDEFEKMLAELDD